jgi:hypothetical protein
MKDHLQKMEAHGESSTVQFSQKLENQDGWKAFIIFRDYKVRAADNLKVIDKNVWRRKGP